VTGLPLPRTVTTPLSVPADATVDAAAIPEPEANRLTITTTANKQFTIVRGIFWIGKLIINSFQCRSNIP
jgi:hypothetical protein